jgi:hypothetical protein
VLTVAVLSASHLAAVMTILLSEVLGTSKSRVLGQYRQTANLSAYSSVAVKSSELPDCQSVHGGATAASATVVRLGVMHVRILHPVGVADNTLTPSI